MSYYVAVAFSVILLDNLLKWQEKGKKKGSDMNFREGEMIELKKSLASLKEGLISISAILNKHGAGELWFGVASNGKPTGLVISEKTLRDISQSIAAHIEPGVYPQITEEALDDKACIKIAFSGKEMYNCKT